METTTPVDLDRHIRSHQGVAMLDEGSGSLPEADEVLLEDERAAQLRKRPSGSGGDPKRRKGRSTIGLVLLAILGMTLFMAAPRVWRYLDAYESTDDAQIDGHIGPISARISGTISHVFVQDTDLVKAGSLIAQIDPRDAQTALSSARANLAQSKAQLASARADHSASISRVRQSEATAQQADNDADRYDSLFKKGIVSNSEHDGRVRAAAVADATVESDRASSQAALTAIASREAAVTAALAAVDQALLNLEYTRIVAPMSGIVGKKTVEDGQQVAPGQLLLAIVPLDDIWITANFKETQIRRMKRGQRATIYVDGMGREYHGYVEGIGGASGEKYSLMPPENATGNYVKVVQRLPIRIRLKPGQDADLRLRIGMSVEAKVWFE